MPLAIEYAKNNIRVNAVAPGIVDTPMHKDNPKDFLRSLSPMGTITSSLEIAEAILFLTESKAITGETLHVDGGAHVGKWSGDEHERINFKQGRYKIKRVKN
ncbi:3-oxoacyl-[acyl-carrier-protein] reductase FabG [Legionella massiliensis]|uniref:3-oxoacyl-[acyl-carrier-protein] reductase FabG n=1 Tax=Legionella massiliensis TaxID=1034943 RepID=A0A078L3H7_9GAMM|nr:SDR family oxidoreductase [Legionella massiliensis]CDZ78493.1 3-oxoacyl-[acyl-carrier-protein] reductase FabG [Legionella massiliensis]CEE14231.1 3-oxoacyl-[acyl-carrier-protein] reductase FabG [Legionella massiliensis]